MTPQDANKRNTNDPKNEEKQGGDRYAEGAPDSSRQFGEAGSQGPNDRSSGSDSGQQRRGYGSGSGSGGSNVPPHSGRQMPKDKFEETGEACDTGCSTEIDTEEHRKVESGQRTGRPSGS